MTGPKGNSEFCFPETLNVPRDEAEGNVEVEGKQNSLFPEGPVIKCFVIPPDSNIEMVDSFDALGTFRSEDEDDYECEFSVLSMRIRFGGRHFSKCACSEQETRSCSRPRPLI